MNMKSVTLMMIALFAALSLTAVAVAQHEESAELSAEQEELFSSLDTAGDGVISEDEAQAHPELAERFSELDEAGNGELDKGEFAAFEVEEEEAAEETEMEEEQEW